MPPRNFEISGNTITADAGPALVLSTQSCEITIKDNVILELGSGHVDGDVITIGSDRYVFADGRWHPKLRGGE